MDSANWEITFKVFQATFTTAKIESMYFWGVRPDPERFVLPEPRGRVRPTLLTVINGQAREVLDEYPPSSVAIDSPISLLSSP